MRALTLVAVVVLASCGAATGLPASSTFSIPALTATPMPTLSPTPVAIVSPVPTASAVALPACTPRSADDRVVALCLEDATVFVDASIAPADMGVIVAQVTSDLASVQREFAWTLRTHAVIHVLATDERYVAGLREVFGYGEATARWVADNSVSFFEPALRTIAVNWAAVSERRPVAAIRHELTHLVTLEACATRCDLVPAWLNEGEARLSEALIPGADWRLMRVRYEAASMALTGTLIPLRALTTQAQWNAYVDWEGYYKYQEAARTVELLRDDIGDGAIARVYARLRAGDDIAHAYATLAARSFDAFLAELPARLRSVTNGAPGIALATPGTDGHGTTMLLYGFAPEARVVLHIRSHAIDETRELSVSPQGAWAGDVDATYPSGTYVLVAQASGVVATASFVRHGGRLLRPSP